MARGIVPVGAPAVVLGHWKDRSRGSPEPPRPLASEDLWAAEGSPNARMRRLVRLNDRALGDYSPKPYAAHVTLFRSSAVRPSNDTFGWELFASQGVQEFVICGCHLDILKEPAVEELAKALRACADEAVRQHQGAARVAEPDNLAGEARRKARARPRTRI